MPAIPEDACVQALNATGKIVKKYFSKQKN